MNDTLANLETVRRELLNVQLEANELMLEIDKAIGDVRLRDQGIAQAETLVSVAQAAANTFGRRLRNVRQPMRLAATTGRDDTRRPW